MNATRRNVFKKIIYYARQVGELHGTSYAGHRNRVAMARTLLAFFICIRSPVYERKLKSSVGWIFSCDNRKFCLGIIERTVFTWGADVWLTSCWSNSSGGARGSVLRLVSSIRDVVKPLFGIRLTLVTIAFFMCSLCERNELELYSLIVFKICTYNFVLFCIVFTKAQHTLCLAPTVNFIEEWSNDSARRCFFIEYKKNKRNKKWLLCYLGLRETM